MLPLVLGLGLSASLVENAATPGEAVVRALDDEAPDGRRSQEDRRPAGRQLEMGPAATAVAMLALIAAIVVRRRHAVAR